MLRIRDPTQKDRAARTLIFNAFNMGTVAPPNTSTVKKTITSVVVLIKVAAPEGMCRVSEKAKAPRRPENHIMNCCVIGILCTGLRLALTIAIIGNTFNARASNRIGSCQKISATSNFFERISKGI